MMCETISVPTSTRVLLPLSSRGPGSRESQLYNPLPTTLVITPHIGCPLKFGGIYFKQRGEFD